MNKLFLIQIQIAPNRSSSFCVLCFDGVALTFRTVLCTRYSSIHYKLASLEVVLLNCLLRSYSWKSQGQLWWKTSSARDIAHFCGVSGCNSIISHRVSMFLQNNQDWGVTPLSVRESLCSHRTMKTLQRQTHLSSLHIGTSSQGSITMSCLF